MSAGRRGCPGLQAGAARVALRRAGAWLAVFSCAVAAGNELRSIRLHDAPEWTRVVLDTRDAPDYRLFTLDNPARVVVDLRGTQPAPSFARPAVDSPVVKRIRSAWRQRVNYRVVVDLAQPATPKAFVLEPVPPHYRYRVVIDLYRDQVPARPAPPPPPERAGERAVVVAIDAGHGGEDPGAIGAGGVQEKRVVLSIAKSVKSTLDAMPGVRTVLVRRGDYYLPLRKRTQIAKYEARADLFVSIHADAFRSPNVHGASVYALSRRGASSEAARFLADKENRSDLIGGDGGWVSLEDKDESVKQMLFDLAMDKKMESSIALGEAVLGALAGVAPKLHKRRVELAGFVVLKLPDVPAILVETGFLSNPAEARRLSDAAYQRRIGSAIADGIHGYLLRNAPADTLIASLSDGGLTRYVVKRGDTLSEIAQRNGVTTSRLRALNDITGDRILVGSTLLIPFAPSGG